MTVNISHFYIRYNIPKLLTQHPNKKINFTAVFTLTNKFGKNYSIYKQRFSLINTVLTSKLKLEGLNMLCITKSSAYKYYLH